MRYSVRIVLVIAMILPVMSSHLALAAVAHRVGDCGELLTDPDSTHESGADLVRKLDDLKRFWLRLREPGDESERLRANKSFDRSLGEILKKFPGAESQILSFVEQLVSGRTTNEKLTQEEIERLRSELETLERHYSRLESEGLDIGEYEIVGDSLTDPSVQWIDDDPGEARLQVSEKRYVEIPLVKGGVALFDLKTSPGHMSSVNGARMLPDGSILSWSTDHTLIVWRKVGLRYSPYKRMGELQNYNDPRRGHTRRVIAARLDPDGTIGSKDYDGRVVLWRLVAPKETRLELSKIAKRIAEVAERLSAESAP